MVLNERRNTRINATIRIVEDEIFFPIQSEVETIALWKTGSTDVYFDKIWINDNQYLIWNEKEKAWKLKCYKLGDRLE